MKPLYAILVALMLLVPASYAQVLPDPDPQAVAQLDQVQHLQSSTFAVYSIRGTIVGSGFVIFNNGKVAIGVTAAHVVDDLVSKTKNGEVWLPCLVGRVDKEFVKGRSPARVIRFDDDKDIAIMLIGDPSKFPHALQFHPDKPKLGMEVWHCGNPRGLLWGSVSKGHISFYNRGINTEGKVKVFDQFTAPAVSGCSGGPVVRLGKKGPQVIGMMTRYIRSPTTKTDPNGHVHQSAHSTMSLMVPTRIVRKYVEENGLKWAITGKDAPSFEEVDKLQPSDKARFVPVIIQRMFR